MIQKKTTQPHRLQLQIQILMHFSKSLTVFNSEYKHLYSAIRIQARYQFLPPQKEQSDLRSSEINL